MMKSMILLASFVFTQSDFDLPPSRPQVPVKRLKMDGAFPANAFNSPSLFTPLPPSTYLLTPLESSSIISNGLLDTLKPFSDFYKASFLLQADLLPDSTFLHPAPWTNDYWATYKDGINAAWGDSQSASEKYAAAFGLDVVTVMDGVSAYSGIDSVKDVRISCTAQETCDGLNDASVCGMRAGQASGFCIPSWYGICHAWAPAAILEQEPKCNVTQNDITFNVMDLKALMTFLYDRTGVETLFGANRCYDNTTLTDSYGRLQTPECRDMTPDFFHVMITNIVGRFGKSFVVDVDATSQVWNQPVRGYRVEEKGEVTGAIAAGMVDPSLTVYRFNVEAKRFWYYRTRYSYINEALSLYPLANETDNVTVDRFTKEVVLEYILELDADGKIVGGEWLNESKTTHPDFLWIPMNHPADNTTVAGINFEHLKALLKLSVEGDC